jgi:hypothetical protein
MPDPTWTYSGDPADSDLDHVRFLIGDTNGNEQKLQDAEVQFAIDSAPNVYVAAANCARAIAGRFASRVDERFESIENRFSQAAKGYYDLALRLDKQAKQVVGMGAPIAGGIRISDMDAARADGDRVKPAVKRGQFANPPETATPWWLR